MRFAPTLFRLVVAFLALTVTTARAGDIVSTFSNVPIGSAEGFINDSGSLAAPMGGAAGFTVDGNYLNNDYSSDFGGYWSGWAFSNQTTASAGSYYGQYAAIAQATAGNTYAVVDAYTGTNPSYNTVGYIDLAADRYIKSLDVTNVAYVYAAVTEGVNGFDTKFTSGDYLTLTIQGYSSAGASGSLLGSVDVDLARFGTSLDILSSWKTIDLAALGAARSLNFVFTTNVASAAGPLVPTYAAIDNLTTRDAPVATPEPTAWMLLAIGAVGAMGASRMRRRIY